MASSVSTRITGWATLLCTNVALAGLLQAQTSAAGPASLSSRLMSVTTPTVAHPADPTARYDALSRLQIDVHFDCAASAPIGPLMERGMVVGTTVQVAPWCVVEGWIAPAAVSTLTEISAVRLVDLPHYAIRRAPTTRPSAAQTAAPTTGTATADPQAFAAATNPVIDGMGITIMNADKFIAQTGKNGTGITVGVMSDDVTNISVIQGRNELPSVTIVQPSANPTPHTNPTDEGTVMLEEVHAVAPGAALAFCGPATYTEFVACETNLIAAGATITVDDIGYYGFDSMTVNSAPEQAFQAILSANPTVVHFTSASNDNLSYWEGPYAPKAFPTSVTCPSNGQVDKYFQAFNGSYSELLNIIASDVSGTGSGVLFFQWADPWNQNVSNFDLYGLDAAGTTILKCLGSAGATATGLVFDATQIPATNYRLAIGTPDQSMAGKFLKLHLYGDGGDSYLLTTPGCTDSPQKLVPAVVRVGATIGKDGIGHTIEPFSCIGPMQFEFPSASTLQDPQVVAPDNIYVDATGTLFPAINGYFAGTSAAAPNVAAVAALLQSTFLTLSPATLTQALTAGATPIGSAAPNGTFGYGLTSAIGALGALPAPTITPLGSLTIVTGKSSSPQSFTPTGSGTLTLAVTSSNSALIAAGGIAIAPATCGASSDACTVTLTSVAGQTGSAQITITATDGAGRSATSSIALTVVPASVVKNEVALGLQSDYLGEGKASFTVWRPATGNWYSTDAAGVTTTTQWGLPSDLPLTGDFDGDGKSDVAVYRPSTGYWYIRESSTGVVVAKQWGLPTDIPVAGDFDGDGKTDLAVYRPSTGDWYILQSSNGAVVSTQWGEAGDSPLVGDFDGDGKSDVAVYRASTGYWYILQSSNGAVVAKQWGLPTDVPVTGDFDGDGKTDIAAYRPSTGYWYIVRSSTGQVVSTPWGEAGDVPVPRDYDGDRKTDIAVFRPSTSTWYVIQSSNGAVVSKQWGLPTDVPVNSLRR